MKIVQEKEKCKQLKDAVDRKKLPFPSEQGGAEVSAAAARHRSLTAQEKKARRIPPGLAIGW
jgi:hypothetical protein